MSDWGYMNHIELFAGCGGLSLGLAQAGFHLTLANELSPMAAESYAFNILGEDLNNIVKDDGTSSKTYWLSSKFRELKSRLRENPFSYPVIGSGYSDIPDDIGELEGKLLVGNITDLNKLIKSNKSLKSALRSGFSRGEIDLVAGGPPCQSFSLAGLREKGNDKNSLPWEFAKFVDYVSPKFVVLENVTGILRAFTEDGIKYHAWFEVAKAFARKKYVPLCLHINAKLVGVPQNRPRFIMMGVREDIFLTLEETFNESEKILFKESKKLFRRMKNKKQMNITEYKYFDIQREKDLEVISNSFLAALTSGSAVTVKEAIDDLKISNTPDRKSEYVINLNEKFSDLLVKNESIENHELRRNSDLVRRRFRIYQVLQKVSKKAYSEVLTIWRQNDKALSSCAWKELRGYKYLSYNKSSICFKNKARFVEYLREHSTKKRTQKALNANFPAPATLSIPDDACHYDENELRTLTVREMARIQSFPDDFVFKSKVTTGGKMRQYEVPQYTQVGNAVPPLLGVALGNCVSQLLERLG